MKKTNLDKLAIQTLRVLSVEQISKAKSGHPGIALGAAPIMHTLYSKIMNVNPKHHDWINRDRFVMSAGHGSALVYSILHLAGYNIKKEDLMNFRQYESITPGHPEYGMTEGVDASTGPLGQGIPMAVGMAIAEEFLANKYNKEDCKLIDHYTYVLCGDGDLQEGISYEAMSLAGHLGLNKLVLLYDSNDIQLDGVLNNAYSESTKDRCDSMNWNYILVKDGEDIDDIFHALEIAKKSDKPSLIEVKTIIGAGSNVAGTSKAHGAPLDIEEVERMRKELGNDQFFVDDEVYKFYQDAMNKGDVGYSNWLNLMDYYKSKYPDEAKEFNKAINNEFIINCDTDLPKFPVEFTKATRDSSGTLIEAISKVWPTLIGGTADLSSSTKAKISGGFFTKTNRSGRNINFGVREHAMAAICNGLTLHKGVRAFCSTFFVFSDYMKPSIRLAALMGLPVIYVLTHDSLAVGEDGPTHQPIEQLTMLRSIPNIQVIRPADANEVKAAWILAMQTKNMPTVLVLTRQAVPMVSEKPCGAKNGGYIISKEKNNLDGIIIATGSEVSLAIEAKKKLLENNIDVRVVSIPSLEVFERQDKAYKDGVLPRYIKNILAVEMSEAAHLQKYIGSYGNLLNVSKFGTSAPSKKVLEEYGFTIDGIVNKFINLYNENK